MTTIQRQYSLPNCRLVLQGIGSDPDTDTSISTSTSTSTSSRPLMSMLTSVECYLAGQKTPIVGGRAFLDSLTMSVNQYAQGYLSGIQTLLTPKAGPSELVRIEQAGENLHQLTVQPEGSAAQGSPAAEINLTTVQLFDLVEAVDQLFADAQTLPDLGLKIDPLSKRHVKSAEPLAKRAGPAALGLSGLAAAATLLFMLPVPEVRRPETNEPSATTEQPASSAPPANSSASPAASPAASPGASPDQPSPANESASGVAATPLDTAPLATAPLAAAAATAAAGLNPNAPEVTDPAELDQLTTQLYNKLDAEWQKKPSFEGELVYRVGVNSDGEIVGYKYSNDAALTYLGEVPLADVQFATPAASPESDSSAQRLAQFRVVFKSDGVLEISPWAGQPSDASPSLSP